MRQRVCRSSLEQQYLSPTLAPLQDVKDKYVRLQADFENYRKRNEAEKVALRSTVRGDTVAELLPLVRRAGWGGGWLG